MLNQRDICELIAHSGSMCLLESVLRWDKSHIVCTSSTHLDRQHPLRNDAGLPMLCLLEYGAQAMAVHGCLVAGNPPTVMESGYLAALHDVELASGFLSDIEHELEIIAECVYSDSGNMIYNMAVQAGGIRLASGRAVVVASFRQT